MATPGWSTTRENIENRIIKACEASYTERGELLYCILSELYALNKVMDIVAEYKDTEHRSELEKLWRVHYYEEFKTWDFVSIDMDFRKYLVRKRIITE